MVNLGRNINRDFDPVQLGSIELFCKAAEQQSFTLAANILGLDACRSQSFSGTT